MTPTLRCLLCLFCFSFQADAQIRVLSPTWLSQQLNSNGVIEGSTATFGAPFYGDRVLGRLIWAESQKGHHHCTEDDYDIPQMDPALRGDSGDGRLINIVMVRRGKCSFVTKVRIAASKGAHAVIFVDREDSGLTSRDLHRIIVADDGYGGNVQIPSVLISNADGARLIDAAKRSQVVTELKWEIPTNHVVEMDLWMSSGSPSSMKFLKDFAPKRKVMNEVVKFRPHYAVFSVPSSDPSIYRDMCSDTSGSYCAEPPDTSGVVTGKAVLEEDVRQLCVHEITKVQRTSLDDLRAGKDMVEYAEKYWEYVEKFVDECPLNGEQASRRFGSQCAEHLLETIGLDVARVRECVKETKDRKLKEERDNTAWSPRALRINGWRYSGMMDADLVTRAICSGFIIQPSECADLLAPPRHGIAIATGVSMNVFVGYLSAFVFLSLFMLRIYKRQLQNSMSVDVKEQVMLEVQSHMAQYNKSEVFAF